MRFASNAHTLLIGVKWQTKKAAIVFRDVMSYNNERILIKSRAKGSGSERDILKRFNENLSGEARRINERQALSRTTFLTANAGHFKTPTRSPKGFVCLTRSDAVGYKITLSIPKQKMKTQRISRAFSAHSQLRRQHHGKRHCHRSSAPCMRFTRGVAGG